MFACNLIPFEPIIFKKAVYQIKIPQHNQKILILYQRNVSLQKYQFKNSNTTMPFHDFVFLTLANPGQPSCSIKFALENVWACRYKKDQAFNFQATNTQSSNPHIKLPRLICTQKWNNRFKYSTAQIRKILTKRLTYIIIVFTYDILLCGKNTILAAQSVQQFVHTINFLDKAPINKCL